MVGQSCRPFRSRSFLVVLCASVFLLALHTRICRFESYKPPIKTFADDYSRLKVGIDNSCDAHHAVSLQPAAHSIQSSALRVLPEVEPPVLVGRPPVTARLIYFVDPRKATQPPPLQ